MSADFQKEAFAQLTKIQLVFLTIIFVGFAADVSLDKSSLDIARAQLASIEDVTPRERADWLTKAAEKKVQSLKPAPPQKFKFTHESNGDRIEQRPQLVFVELPPGEFILGELNIQRSGMGPPGSLSEFWNEWDGLRQDIPIYTEFDPIDIEPEFAGTLFSQTFSKVSSIGAADASLQPAHRLTGSVFRKFAGDENFLEEFKPVFRTVAKWPRDGETWEITFYVKGRSQSALNGQETLVAEHAWNWHFGAAKDVFKDLHSISANFADLSLEKIRLILESEAERYGERLSLLGVSLPTGQLAVWSLLLVTVVYLYFLVVLRGLAHHLQKESEVLAYPWIGVLPGKIPPFASLVSLCLFPAAFGVAKCVAIYRLANSTMNLRIALTAAAVVLVSSTVVVSRTIFELRRKQK